MKTKTFQITSRSEGYEFPNELSRILNEEYPNKKEDEEFIIEVTWIYPNPKENYVEKFSIEYDGRGRNTIRLVETKPGDEPYILDGDVIIGDDGKKTCQFW